MSYLEDRAKRKNGLLPPLPTKKEKKPIRKVSLKKAAADKAQKEAGGTDFWINGLKIEEKGLPEYANVDAEGKVQSMRTNTTGQVVAMFSRNEFLKVSHCTP